MGVVTRADVRSVLTTIVPYAPSSILDAVSGFVEILVNYAPLSPSDDVCAVTFSICMKFLDECYNGASPRDVFMDIIHSMSCDLLQPFPEYKSVYDAELRRELVKELSFRWCLYVNISNHIDYAVKPPLSVQELEDYFSDLDVCNIPSPPSTDDSSNDSEEDQETIPDEGFGLSSLSEELCSSTDHLPSSTVGFDGDEVSPTPQKFVPFQHLQQPVRVTELDDSSNGSCSVRVPRTSRRRLPLSYYRQFYADWKNRLDRRPDSSVPVRLLLFARRKPRWKRLEGYDITIPWRPKV